MEYKDIKDLSHVLAAGAVLSVLLATFGALGSDIWLASSQWLLTAAVLIGLAIYFKPGKK